MLLVAGHASLAGIMSVVFVKALTKVGGGAAAACVDYALRSNFYRGVTNVGNPAPEFKKRNVSIAANNIIKSHRYVANARYRVAIKRMRAATGINHQVLQRSTHQRMTHVAARVSK